MQFNQAIDNRPQQPANQTSIYKNPISDHSYYELFSIQIKGERFFAKVFPLEKTHLYVQEKLKLQRMDHANVLKPEREDNELAVRLSNFFKKEVLLFPEVGRGSLQDYVLRNGMLSQRVANYFISGLIQSLLYCETVEVVHPNLTAGNLLIGDNLNLMLCGWSDSCQSAKSAIRTMSFRIGELIMFMMTCRNLFMRPSSKNDEYGKFLSEGRIHKLWQQLQKTCKKRRNFNLSDQLKKLVTALFLGKISSLRQIKESEWLAVVPSPEQVSEELMQIQHSAVHRL